MVAILMVSLQLFSDLSQVPASFKQLVISELYSILHVE